jgi:Tol biopolymer transport system component
MVTPWNDSPGNNLAWIDLEATTSGQGSSYGFFTRTGDPNDVGAPTWSHDGKTIVYVSTNVELTGRLDQGFGHLYSVPYNSRQGGAATAVPGALDASNNQYYPAFSPDDAFLARRQLHLPADDNYISPSLEA